MLSKASSLINSTVPPITSTFFSPAPTPMTHPLILKWLSTPPTRSQVDSALRFISPDDHRHDAVLEPLQFKAWAVRLYTDAVLSSAGKALLLRVPIGVAGIAGIGALTRSGNRFVGTAVGAYSLGVAVSIFFGLSG